MLTGSGVYQQYVYDFFFTTLPQGLANALTSGGVTKIDANTFMVWIKAWRAGLEVWRTLSWHDIGRESRHRLVLGAAIISTVVGFAIWLISRVILALYIALGPLLVGLALFPATRSIFERWVGSLISCVVLQITTVVLLYIVLAVEQQVVGQVAAMGSVDTMAMIQVLFAGVIFFAVAAFVALQLPDVASSLSGGLHFHAGAIARGVQNMLGSPRPAACCHRWEHVSDSPERYRRPGPFRMLGGRAWDGAMGRAVYRRVRPSTGGSLSES